MQPPPLTSSPSVPPAAIRWIVFGCAATFTIPMVLSGFGFLTAGLASGDKMFAAFGGVFVLIPILALIAAWTAGKKMSETAAVRQRHPNEPWKWRADWEEGVIRETGGGAIGLWIFSFFWLAVSSPVIWLVRGQMRGNVPSFLFLVFPLIGILLMAGAAYQSLRQRKYGRSVCRLSRMPAEPGQAMRGEIQARLHELPAEGFKLRLMNVQRITTSTGKSSTTREETLWSEERTVAAAAVGRSPEGMRLPFNFNLPATAKPTDIRNNRDQIVWRLEVGADVPGIDYSAKFEVPVFAKAHLIPAGNPAAARS